MDFRNLLFYEVRSDTMGRTFNDALQDLQDRGWASCQDL